MPERRDKTKGKYINITDFNQGDSIIIKQARNKIIIEIDFQDEVLKLKHATIGSMPDKGLRIPFELMEDGPENFEYVCNVRELKKPKKGGPKVVREWTLKYRGE